MYGATLGDIESMAHFGLYYAAKIRGACEIALFDKTGDRGHKRDSMKFLEQSVIHWQNYAVSYTRQYVQPVLHIRAGLVDIPALTEKVLDDVKMAEP